MSERHQYRKLTTADYARMCGIDPAELEKPITQVDADAFAESMRSVAEFFEARNRRLAKERG